MVLRGRSGVNFVLFIWPKHSVFCSYTCLVCFFREKSRIHICPGRLKKERGGVEQSQKSFSVQPPSAHLLQTRQTACFPLHGGVSFHRFSLSFAQNDDGPEASTCPAVLGDVDPCWGVYECVMFTLFALMYIMSKKLKFYFEYRKKEIKPVYCYHIDSFCNFITVWIVLLWQICPFFFGGLLEPWSLPSMTLPSYKYNFFFFVKPHIWLHNINQFWPCS